MIVEHHCSLYYLRPVNLRALASGFFKHKIHTWNLSIKVKDRVLTIESFKESEAQNAILEKLTMEMKRHIRPVHVKAYFNWKHVSKVLIEHDSTINIMPSRMFGALERSVSDLIEIEVSVLAFTREM